MLEAAFAQIPEEVAATVKPATILNINPERGSDTGSARRAGSLLVLPVGGSRIDIAKSL
jgi:hypothetical protein